MADEWLASRIGVNTTGLGGLASRDDEDKVGMAPSKHDRSGLASLGCTLAFAPGSLGVYLDMSNLNRPEVVGAGRRDVGGAIGGASSATREGACGGGEGDFFTSSSTGNSL